MNSLFSVKEKVILLTGGYGILGACMAKHLAREGAYVVILGRNEQKGSALVGEIKAEGGEAWFQTYWIKPCWSKTSKRY